MICWPIFLDTRPCLRPKMFLTRFFYFWLMTCESEYDLLDYNASNANYSHDNLTFPIGRRSLQNNPKNSNTVLKHTFYFKLRYFFKCWISAVVVSKKHRNTRVRLNIHKESFKLPGNLYCYGMKLLENYFDCIIHQSFLAL